MSNLSEKRILFVVTSHSELGSTGNKTGYYLPEAAHPYYVFTESGIPSANIDFASPKGGEAPLDAHSQENFGEDPKCKQFLESSEVQEKLKHSKPLSSINGNDYDVVFLVGGHGTVWDFFKNEELNRVIRQVYEEKKGIVSAICHGVIAFADVKLSDGSSLVKQCKVCGFTNEEEDHMKLTQQVLYLLEDELKSVGAEFIGSGVFKENVQIDGRIVTGQNPPSGDKCGKEIVKLLS